MVRLYRGEGGADRPRKAGKGEGETQWYSSDYKMAAKYARRNNGKVYYVEMPRSEARRLLMSRETTTLKPELHAQRKVVENPATEGSFNRWHDMAPPRLEAQPPPAEVAPTEAAPAPGGLDLGEQVDPNLAAKQRQELDLAAQQPLRGARKTGAAQEETLPEGLFGGKIAPELLDQLAAKGQALDLGDGKGLRPIEEIHAELEADQKAIDTIESCLLGRPTP
jgi:hypothetical protein